MGHWCHWSTPKDSCRKRVHPCGCRLHDEVGRSFTNEPDYSQQITAKDVAKFVFENICCRFGTPLEIISDMGPGFRGELVKELMTKLGIKQRHSSPYYPQCNGLVEKVNGMICKIITNHVGEKAQTWDKHLNIALWAYHTSFKASLGYTPFHLVYG